MPSTAFETARGSKTAHVAWTVHLAFPYFRGIPASNVRVATTELNLEDGFTYYHFLKSAPRGRHQAGKGNDYAEFTLARFHELTLFTTFETHRLRLERCEVTIKKAYMVADGVWNSEIVFFGYLKDYTIDVNENTSTFTANADTSRAGFLVGGRILTRERCGTEFNWNGLLSPADSVCGWQTSQGGPPYTCTKIYNDVVGGCLAHNNQHRFFAVPGIASAVITTTDDGGDGGFDDTGDGIEKCFSERALVLMGDWSLKPINQVEEGEIVMGFDPTNNDQLKCTAVKKTFVSQADEIGIARFEHATFEVKPEHVFYLGASRWVPVQGLGNQNVALGFDYHTITGRSHLISLEISKEKLFVYNLHTATHNYIVTDEKQQFFYMVHNMKAFPVLPV